MVCPNIGNAKVSSMNLFYLSSILVFEPFFLHDFGQQKVMSMPSKKRWDLVSCHEIWLVLKCWL